MTRSRIPRALAALAILAAGYVATGRAAVEQAIDPVVSVWYRGVPAGTPRLDDLVAIHSTGFDTITWPQSQTAQLATLRSMAAKAGVTVQVRATKPAPPMLASEPVRGSVPETIDLPLSADATRSAEVSAVVWNEVAHGARAIAIDPHTKVGFVRWSDDMLLRSWARSAGIVAKEVWRCGSLITSLKPGPKVIFDSPLPAHVDFMLFDAGRSWAIIATNRSAARESVQVHLTKDAAAAEWTNLLTSGVVAMIARTDGPRWTCALDPWQSKVLVIDKRPH